MFKTTLVAAALACGVVMADSSDPLRALKGGKGGKGGKGKKETVYAICEAQAPIDQETGEPVSDTRGIVKFMQKPGGDLTVAAKIKGLDSEPSTLKGFHVHTNPIENGDPCGDAGGHYNPVGVNHSVWDS